MLIQEEVTRYAEEMQRTVEGADERPEQCEWLRRRLAAQPQRKRPCVAELYRVYEEATGTRIGCD